MRWAKDNGAFVSGCELIKELCDAGVAAGFDTRHGDLSVFAARGEKFDVIVAFDVLEHIATDDLLPFMQQLASLLAPNGVFMARVPNGASPWGLHYQYSDITHVSVLTPGRFQQLANGSGLSLVSCGNAFRVVRIDHKVEDTVRFRLMDFVAWVFNRLGGLWRVPLDPNIVAVFRK